MSTQTKELKMVKGSNLFSSDGLITIEHYDTVIFTFDNATKKAWCLWNCSVTSNKMIKRAIDFFCVVGSKITHEYNSDKWSYSEVRN